MPLTASDYKAINWYCQSYDLKPQLSAAPLMRFSNTKGEHITAELETIKAEYHAWNEDDKKVRARERKHGKRAITR